MHTWYSSEVVGSFERVISNRRACVRCDILFGFWIFFYPLIVIIVVSRLLVFDEGSRCFVDSRQIMQLVLLHNWINYEKTTW